MSAIQVKFDIPLEIQHKIDAGTLIRYGGVVRDAVTKRIVKFLDEVPIQDAADAKPQIKNNSILTKTVDFIKDNKNPIIFISIATAAFTAAAITYVVVKNKNNEKTEMPKCVFDFEQAFIAYINAIKNEKVDEKVIDSLISALNELKKNENVGNITITIPVENSTLLLDMIRDYTEKFAAANAYKIPESLTREDEICILHQYLEIQKRIISKCA